MRAQELTLREAGLPLVVPIEAERVVETQVLALALDPEGLLYAATARGLLTYDGVR